MVTADEVGHHDSKKSCWVVIAGQAYDVTDYLDRHPGGSNSILRHAGMASILIYSIDFVLTTGCRMPRLNTNPYIHRVPFKNISPKTSSLGRLLELLHLSPLNHLRIDEAAQNKLLFLYCRISMSSKSRPTNIFRRRPGSTSAPQQTA